MDSYIRGRFYTVSEPREGVPDLPEVLLKLAEINPPKKRERGLGNGIVFRLEHCTIEGDFLTGEFCRKQTANIPPQAGDGGLSIINLPDGEGIGHVAAFRFHMPTRVLLLQNNRLCASASRISYYLKVVNHLAILSIEPVCREDAWDRIKGKEIKRFRVKFAAPNDLAGFDDPAASAARGARNLAGLFNGPEIEIAVGVGRRKKDRLDRPKVMNFFRWIQRNEAEVTAMEAVASDDQQTELIDFIDEHLADGRELKLPERNPDANYSIRKNFLDSLFKENIEYLNRKFGGLNRARARR